MRAGNSLERARPMVAIPDRTICAMAAAPVFVDFFETKILETFSCERIDPLDDTRDARWISLISITMIHVFDSQNHKDT